jgi:hypothetical protein
MGREGDDAGWSGRLRAGVGISDGTWPRLGCGLIYRVTRTARRHSAGPFSIPISNSRDCHVIGIECAQCLARHPEVDQNFLTTFTEAVSFTVSGAVHGKRQSSYRESLTRATWYVLAIIGH